MIDDLKAERRERSSPGGGAGGRRRRSRIWIAGFVVLGLLALAVIAHLTYRDMLHQTIGEILRNRGKVPATAYLGIAVQELKPSVTQSLGLRTKSAGVMVSSVIPRSPADRAGILAGDLVLQLDRTQVDSVETLERLVSQARPGETVSVVVDRQGMQRVFYAQLAQLPSYAIPAALTSQSSDASGWGYTVSPLTPDLAKQLSLPDTVKGVVVVAVAPTSAARAAGLMPGDVIISVNRTETPDLASFYKALEGARSVALQVLRDDKTLMIQIDSADTQQPLATIAGTVTSSVALPQRVAVAATGSDLNALLSPRFGTAPFFVIADFPTNRFVTIQNDLQSAARGYGITAAQLISSQGAGAAVAGSYGPQAYDTLKLLKIVPYTSTPAKVSDVLFRYRSNLLAAAAEPSLPGYSYTSVAMATGGSTEDDEEEEQSGYKGMPTSIPPRGKYDPDLEPTNATAAEPGAAPSLAQTTAGSTQRADYCFCPVCNQLLPHPPSASCAELTCPICGTRLRNWDSGTVAPSPTASVPLAGTSTQTTTPQSRIPLSSPAPIGSLPSAGMGGQSPLTAQTQQSTSTLPQGGMSQMGTPGMSQMRGGASSTGVVPTTTVPTATLPTQPLAGTATTATSSLLLNQQVQYCYCPFCRKVYPHPAGVPCSSLLCSSCGSRLLSLSSGAAALTTPLTVTGGQPGTIPPSGQTSAGMTAAGMPTAGMPTAGMPTAGMPTAGMPTAGMPTAGMPTAGMPTAGMPTAGMPTAGTPTGGQPSTIPPSGETAAGMTTAGMPTAGMPTAGMTTGGQPDTIPPSGQTAAGTTVAGPTTIPPSAHTTAGTTVAGPSTIPPTPTQSSSSTRTTTSTAGQPSAQTSTSQTATRSTTSRSPQSTIPKFPGSATMVVGGKPETIPPSGQSAAGMTTGGQPSTIPPSGQSGGGQTSALTPAASSAAGVTVVDSGVLPPMGQSTASTTASTTATSTTTNTLTGVLQGTLDGYCVCPRCGTKVPHVRGTACTTMPCPKCGTLMIRDGTQPGSGGGSQSALTPVMGEAATNALTVSGDETASRICIAAMGSTMDSQLAPLFDRAPYFLIVGLGTCKVVANPNVEDRAGVGIQSAQLVVSEGAKAVITNDISVKALEELSMLRIKVYTGVTGTAQQALGWYQDGRLTPSSLSSEEGNEHSGSSSGKGRDSKSSSSSSTSSSSSSSSSTQRL